MKLSVIIVNYNVQYFLSNCLQSVLRAGQFVETEVIVVDNNSADDSVAAVREHFPKVKVIANKDNRGFSMANNQGMAIATGNYILLLNPDTVVEEDCFVKCVQYMDENEKVGGLGVKMIDGSGKFLPESKRGLPPPAVAFCKIFGLARLFPKSARFGGYHLEFLPENEIHSVEVLSGAFMLLRSSLIKQIGGLDEAFFMYGEDIDLSYRITQSGYRNVYYPNARIIHFKGESTKKSSVNYVLVFYKAMIIFAKKHFSYPNARLLSFLIHAAIYFRASLAIINRIIRWAYMPVIDTVVLTTLLKGIKWYYEGHIVEHVGYLPEAVDQIAFPLMIISWVGGQYIMGGYRQPVKRFNILKGLIISALMLIFFYAMLDESLRFSRGIVGLAVLGSFLILPLSRVLLQKTGLFLLERSAELKTGIIGDETEIGRVKKILQDSTERRKKLYFIHPLKKSEIAGSLELQYVGSLYQLIDILNVYKLNELIFCMKDLSVHEMINLMQQPALQKVNIYLNPEGGAYILRSSSNQRIGEYILPESNPELSSWSLQKKRIFECCIAVIMLIASPVLLFLYKNPIYFLYNMGAVLGNKIELIGLPGANRQIKPALIRPFHDNLEIAGQNWNENLKRYLLRYNVQKDMEIVILNLHLLDKKLRW